MMSRVKEIIPGLWRVGGGSWGELAEALSGEGSGNVFLVGGDGEYALIDAGMPDGVEAVLANAAGVGAQPETITRIVLTHSHSDHVMGAPALKARTGARLAASAMAAKALAGDATLRKALFIRHDRIVQAEEILSDGDTVRLGPLTFEVMATPGHIPDAVCLLGEVAGHKVLISSDTAIGDQGDARGIVGWLDGHWGSNPKHYVRTIRRLAACQAEVMLPGHALPIVGAEKVAESLAHCAERLEQLLAIADLGTMMPLDLAD